MIWIAVMVFLGVFLSIVCWGLFLDYKDWNNGSCRKCQKKWIVARWEFMEMSLPGGRGYYCPNCGDVIWISWLFNASVGREQKK